MVSLKLTKKQTYLQLLIGLRKKKRKTIEIKKEITTKFDEEPYIHSDNVTPARVQAHREYPKRNFASDGKKDS